VVGSGSARVMLLTVMLNTILPNGILLNAIRLNVVMPAMRKKNYQIFISSSQKFHIIRLNRCSLGMPKN
jgi:hypothetical protein